MRSGAQRARLRYGAGPACRKSCPCVRRCKRRGYTFSRASWGLIRRTASRAARNLHRCRKHPLRRPDSPENHRWLGIYRFPLVRLLGCRLRLRRGRRWTGPRLRWHPLHWSLKDVGLIRPLPVIGRGRGPGKGRLPIAPRRWGQRVSCFRESGACHDQQS